MQLWAAVGIMVVLWSRNSKIHISLQKLLVITSDIFLFFYKMFFLYKGDIKDLENVTFSKLL